MDTETLTAADVMSRVIVTVGPEESPLMAWELMRRGGVHHLPVVDAACRVLGVIRREEIAEHWSGGPAEQSAGAVGRLVAGRRCPHASPETSLAAVAGAMLDCGMDVVPVIGASGGLEGLVTATDVLRAVAGRSVPAPGATEVVAGLFHLEPVLPPERRDGS
ncbi:hypothetical protein Sru01_16700 [Sphaerisporangium rufum]|uniref:CBS domain-containing protein n=1 Tax=Sphaerisporangium rufum TaxID=1381558 RepID=A0A919R0E9_9ACTN|nr:CBS domain-containing protein [Sphaerisporangium rufum]GII76688.1 hypothetical protein Sru01_16700 [Sphaerisporangium rufum]